VAEEPAPRELTLEEARAALPAARDALERLQALQERLRELREELRALANSHRGNGVPREQQLRTLRREQAAHAAHAGEALEAVRATGAELRAIDPGLLDFPARVEGQPAYWCWRTGEAELGWWHGRDAGFAGRRPIAG
jgi:hypothetical protein